MVALSHPGKRQMLVLWAIFRVMPCSNTLILSFLQVGTGLDIRRGE